MLWRGGLGRAWSWACGPSPRNDRAGGGAAQTQGHCVIVSMATNTSQQGTWKGGGVWGGSSQVPGSGDRGRNRDQEEKQRERKGDLSL